MVNDLKDIKNMKSSEILDLLNEDHSDREFEELEEELLDRYPFSYYFKCKFEELEKRIDLLERLLKHSHNGNQILIPL